MSNKDDSMRRPAKGPRIALAQTGPALGDHAAVACAALRVLGGGAIRGRRVVFRGHVAPGVAGSLAQRRGSPVRVMAPRVAPW